MTAKQTDGDKQAGDSNEVHFKCQSCGKSKKLGEMRIIARYFPVLVVCPDCERKMT